MAERISHKAEELSKQNRAASTAVDDEPNWPSTAPTAAELLANAQDLNTRNSDIKVLESQLSAKRQEIKPYIEKGREDMKKVDQATDLLYGEDSGKKLIFGLTPKKTTHDPLGPPEQVIIRTLEDGTQPRSILIDWETIEQASYELEWFTDPAMTQQVGNATTTRSKYEIPHLIQGTQYWIRVRAVRGGHEGKWSDVASRVANI